VRTRTFWTALLVIAIAGLAVRITFIATEARGDERYLYDAFYYRQGAVALAEGKGFVEPGRALMGQHAGPAADHPPLTIVALAPAAFLFGADDVPMRVTFALIGSATLVLIGVLGRVVAGPRVGVLAAGIAACYPLLWVNDGLIMSETLTVTFTVATLLAVYALLRDPRARWAVALGALGALAALTRSELIVLTPLLVACYLVGARVVEARARWKTAAIAALAMIVVLAPWVTYNLARFREPTFVSTNFDLNFLGGSCDRAFYGKDTGLLGFCIPKRPPPGDQSEVGVEYRKRAVRYTKAHLGRYPVVVLARMGRDWSLFRPWDMVKLNQSEGRPTWVTALGLFCYFPLLVLAIVGYFLRRRARLVSWPLLVPAFIVTVGAFVSWGQVRYRVPAEPSIVLLAAVTLGALWNRWWPAQDGDGGSTAAPATAAGAPAPAS
jgi:4-amino-4-deoxy-L-arabinose transferase-like glycosyltransferase